MTAIHVYEMLLSRISCASARSRASPSSWEFLQL